MPLLQQVLEENPGKVKLVFMNFPLKMHKMARPAAAAALAADRQGKFWEYHDKLFENMRALSDAKFQEIAQELELDMEEFGKDIADPTIQQAISKDINSGQQAGVRGTPTIFLNGKRMQNRSRQIFQQMIDRELEKLQKADEEAGP